MKKFILLLLTVFIVLILILPVFSDASTEDGEILKVSAIKKSSRFEMRMEDSIIFITGRDGKKLENITVSTEWPWIPAMQFEKYRKYFTAGVSIDTDKQ